MRGSEQEEEEEEEEREEEEKEEEEEEDSQPRNREQREQLSSSSALHCPTSSPTTPRRLDFQFLSNTSFGVIVMSYYLSEKKGAD